MPQDIPLEASERLAFTPPSIASVDGAPVFYLRAATQREKRFRRRLLSEEGVAFHDEEALRAEILSALEHHLWGPEKFATHSGPLIEYWSALDDFRAQKKDNPDLEWSYDAEIERAVTSLLRDVEVSWKPLGRMKADNIDFNELFLTATVAVVVEKFTVLDRTPRYDRSYLTIDSVDEIAVALGKFAEKHAPGPKPGMAAQLAWLELVNACSSRMALDEDEEKNSVSPSPSETMQPASSETATLEADGQFLVSATSTETPATE